MSTQNNIKLWLASNIYLVATAGLQLFGFIILGRALGAVEYGQILAVTVFVSLGVEFVGLGCGDSLIKNVSVDSSAYSKLIGQCIKLCLITLVPVSVSIVTLLYFFTDTDTVFNIVLVVTELYSVRFLALNDHSLIANSDIKRLNIIKLAYAILRLVVILIAVNIFTVESAWSWIPFQIICSVIITSAFFAATVKQYGGIDKTSSMRLNLKESVLFSGTQTLRALQNNVDKYAIQFGFSQIVFSLYAVAARFLQYSLIPLQAVLRMSYPRFFKAEKNQKNSSFWLALKLLPVVLGASLIPFIFLMWGGFIVELMLGESYAGVSSYMSLLAPIPVLLGMQYIFMDLLTALGSHTTRLAISFVHVLSLCLYFLVGTNTEMSSLVYGFISINAIFVLCYFLAAAQKAAYSKQGLARVEGRVEGRVE